MRLPTVPSAASSAALIHLDPADHCREDLVAMYLKTRRRQISSSHFLARYHACAAHPHGLA